MFGHKRRIKRDYSKPFFARKRKSFPFFLFFYGLLMGAILAGMYFYQDKMQLLALDTIGYAPTSTPFASERAYQAAEAYINGDLLNAERLYRMAVNQQPDNVDYLYEYGKVLIEMDELDLPLPQGFGQISALGDRMIAVAPNDPRGYTLKARSLMWSDPASAIPIAIQGTEQNDNYAPLHAVLAIAYTNIQRYQEGYIEGLTAVQLDPQDAMVRRSFHHPLVLTGRYQEAIEQLEEAIMINPNSTPPYFELASLYRTIDVPEMSVGIYNRLLELNPNNAKAYLRICETYASVGEFQDGEPYCDEALEIDENYASAWRMLGQIQYTRRNYESAIESFERCVELGSEELECYYLRGLAHYILAQCNESWDVLQEAVELATRQGFEQEFIQNNIAVGLENIKLNCTGFQNRAIPTAIPPTPIPPTPIGGF